MKCDQLSHGWERCSATNRYMQGRGEVRLTVTWVGKGKCQQLLHGSETHSVANCYMGAIGTVWPTVTWE